MVRYARDVANRYARKRRRGSAYRLEQNYKEFAHLHIGDGGGYGQMTNETTPASTTLSETPRLVNFSSDAGQMSTPSSFCNIPRGTSVNTRVGRRIWMKSLHIVGTATFEAGAQTTSQVYINAALVQYKDCDRRAPTVADIFKPEFPPMREMQHLSDYRVLKLWKKRLTMDIEYDPSNDPQGRSETPINWYKKLNIMVEYTPTSETPIKSSDIEKNNIFLVAWSSSTDNSTFLKLQARVKYLDL